MFMNNNHPKQAQSYCETGLNQSFSSYLLQEAFKEKDQLQNLS
jgi:hypothetical protein